VALIEAIGQALDMGDQVSFFAVADCVAHSFHSPLATFRARHPGIGSMLMGGHYATKTPGR